MAHLNELAEYELSVCIPTFNRRRCLQELLNSIVNQPDCSVPVEICISDDASTDDTQAFVREYQKEYPHIQYYRFEQNVGLDRNLLKAVSLAHGDFCWLMGNDDKVEQGANGLVTQLIKQYEGLTLLNVNGWQYDNQLKERLYPAVKRSLRKNHLHENKLFDNLEDILYMFGDSFGFLGDNVFRRSFWNEIVSTSDLSQYDGSYYIHLAVLLKMLERRPRLLYVNQQCMGFRGNNDGFLEILGQLRRLRLDVVGYDRVAAGVFGKSSKSYRMWMSRVIKVHIRSRVLGLKLSRANNSFREMALLTYKHFALVPAFWLHILPLLLMPRGFLLLLRACYRKTIRSLGRNS